MNQKIGDKNLFYLLLFLAMVAWGGSWVNVKVLSSYIDAFEMIFFRFGITAITMIPLIWKMGYSFKIDKKSLGLALLVAVILILYNRYYFLGTKLGTASLGGAMVTTLIPILTFVILAILGARRVGVREGIALCLGAVGVLTMLHVWRFDWEKIAVIHNLYFLLAAILWALLTILSAKSTRVSPLVFTFYLYGITTILDGLFWVELGTISWERLDAIFWLNIALISLAASTFANTIYFLGIEKLGAAEVSSFVFFVPFSAILLSAIFLGEEIDLFIVLGTILTLGAVKILNNIRLFRRKHT